MDKRDLEKKNESGGIIMTRERVKEFLPVIQAYAVSFFSFFLGYGVGIIDSNQLLHLRRI